MWYMVEEEEQQWQLTSMLPLRRRVPSLTHRLKSSPLLLKGFHWRVKQQTDTQCDCLSNEKITALHLTENDLGQKVWVNKTLLLQMGRWHVGACTDSHTARLIDTAVLKPWISIKMCQKWFIWWPIHKPDEMWVQVLPWFLINVNFLFLNQHILVCRVELGHSYYCTSANTSLMFRNSKSAYSSECKLGSMCPLLQHPNL